jgi:fumarate hydratase subunit alpha
MISNLEDLENKIRFLLEKSIKRAVTTIPKDISNFFENLKEQKDNKISNIQINLILENFKFGKEMGIPLCQDTGILNFYIKLGNEFPIISNFRKIINETVRKMTIEIPLRSNSIDPLTDKNSETNVGLNSPPILLDIIENSNSLEIIVLPKGAGAENMSKLFMLDPIKGLETFTLKIKEHVRKIGGKPCPPVILGIGLGGDASNSMLLAKKALLRPIGVHHERQDIAKLEEKIKNEINKLNIGVMGLGGKITCIDVHIEMSMRHPGSFPVGLIVECYCHRIASFKINEEGKVINEL